MFSSTMIRTIPQRVAVASRALHASPAAYRTMTEAVKETAQNVNLKVGQTLASGIDQGEKAAKATQEAVGVKTEQAKEAADKAGAQAQQKANQTAAGAREAKDDLKKSI